MQYTKGSAGIGVLVAVVAVVILGGTFLASTTETTAPVSNTNSVDRVTDATPTNTTNDTPTTAVRELDEMDDTDMMEKDHMDKTADKDETMKKMVDDTTSDTETESVVDTAVDPAPTTAGTFTDYNESLLANAESGDVLLFFHATWCPSCRALERDIDANNIPEGVTILKVDYDSETVLKQKYGVVRQHTLVQVDSAGNKIKTLTGLTNTLDQVVNQL